MSRQVVMFMVGNTVILIARCTCGVNVDGGMGKIPQMVQKTVSHIVCYFVSLFNGKSWVHRNIQFRIKSMPEPPCPHLGDTTYPSSVVDSMSDLIDNFRVYSIEHTGED